LSDNHAQDERYKKLSVYVCIFSDSMFFVVGSRVDLLQMMTLVLIWLVEGMIHIILMTVAFMYHQSPKAVWQMES
jgi:hypothetical protein